MREYQLRLENLRGEMMFIYQFLSPDDVSAISKIATIKNIRYQRYEVWRGLEEKIAEGPRFVSRERVFDMPWAAR
jgi:hypothetical protein